MEKHLSCKSRTTSFSQLCRWAVPAVEPIPLLSPSISLSLSPFVLSFALLVFAAGSLEGHPSAARPLWMATPFVQQQPLCVCLSPGFQRVHAVASRSIDPPATDQPGVAHGEMSCIAPLLGAGLVPWPMV